MIHKAKTPRCAALDKAVYGLSADLAVTIPTYVAMQEIRAPHSFYRGSNRSSTTVFRCSIVTFPLPAGTTSQSLG